MVLVVDDVPSNAMVLASFLKNDYHVKIAKSGSQCLEIAQQDKQPDLILLDIEMPEMNGYEVCRELKANQLTNSIPVIFVTGKNEDEDQEKGLSLGAVDYIIKPIRPAIVSARVNTHITLKQQRDRLEVMAMRDQLTNLYNRHYLLEVSNHKVARCIRHKKLLCLLMIDVDHFKTVNDTHGHPTGDLVLQKVSALIQSQCRKEDVVSRFGGEEFVVLLDQCEIELACTKAGKILKLIEESRPSDLLITVSIGVAELQAGEKSIDGLLIRADTAVYKAKEKGRNRIERA